MTAINADGTTLIFNGAVVGGITAYDVIDGVTPDVEHRTMNQAEYFPGIPEFGQIRVTLYRDPSDPGQAAMETARANRQRANTVFTLSDGSTRTFISYVKILPIVGNDINGLSTANVILKVAGPVS